MSGVPPMIKRAAAALREHGYSADLVTPEEIVTVVIGAIRKPTRLMAETGQDASFEGAAAGCWEAMINVALGKRP